MDTSLISLLEKNTVDEVIIKWMTDNACTTLSIFANWVDGTSELKEAIPKHTNMKDSAPQLARLRMAWREADAAIARGVKRTAEGLEDENLDAPLASEIFKEVGKAFRTFYNWPDVPAERMGSDKLLGRTRKEFQRKEPSLIPMLKVKSLTTSQFEPQEKKTKLSATAVLTVLAGDEQQAEAPSLFQWLSCFDIMVNTWALAGCFDVTHDARPIKYCHWSQADQYKFEFQNKAFQLRQKHSEKAVFNYLCEVESSVRSKAIELARSTEGVPWGPALLRSVKENSHLWQEKRGMLSGGGDQAFRNNALSNSSVKRVQHFQQSPPICRFFLEGNCSNGDRCRFSHLRGGNQSNSTTSSKAKGGNKGGKSKRKGGKKGKW